MVRVPYLRARLLAAAFLSISAASAQAQSDSYWGFERGTLGGWEATGDAFAAQPTLGNNLIVRRPGETPGQQGNYWIGTFESRPNASVPPGHSQGDGPTGTLTSQAFMISEPFINFLIGGGNDLQHERVELLVRHLPGDVLPPGLRLTPYDDGGYWPVFAATGANREEMMRVRWDVRHLAGRQARVRIVDSASGPWGHINADDFRFGPPMPGSVQVGGPPAMAQPVGSTGPVVVSPPAGGGLGTATVVNPAQAQPVEVHAVGGGPVVVSPPSDQSSVPPGVRSAHYQLIAYEMHVSEQTPDDRLEGDGPGDEIRLRSDVFRYTPAGVMTGWIPHLSRIMGSPGYADIIAGSAHPGWNAHDEEGGFRNGDDYPPPDRQNSLSTNGGLPMLLWEGDLTEAGEIVVVVPTIWEIDGPQRSQAEQTFDRVLPDRIRSLTSTIAAIASRPIEDGDLPDQDNVLPALGTIALPEGGNFPIGKLTEEFRGQPPGTILNSIVLTYNRAAYWAAMPARTYATTRQPIEAGGLILFHWNGVGGGAYELFAKLVRTR